MVDQKLAILLCANSVSRQIGAHGSPILKENTWDEDRWIQQLESNAVLLRVAVNVSVPAAWSG
jgi:hypothetical protein